MKPSEMTAAEVRALALKSMSEAELQKQVLDLAAAHGWLRAYFRPARVRRGGEDVYETPIGADGKGWPDVVLVKAFPEGGCVLFWELKSETGKVSPDQQKWLDRLKAAGQLARVVRPRDLPEIEAMLRR